MRAKKILKVRKGLVWYYKQLHVNDWLDRSMIQHSSKTKSSQNALLYVVVNVKKDPAFLSFLFLG